MHFKMINFVFCDFYLNFLKKMKCVLQSYSHLQQKSLFFKEIIKDKYSLARIYIVKNSEWHVN